MSLQLGVPVTTYALPASVFQKDIRCTFNGMASAMGKIGAIIGAYTFYYIAQASIHAVLVICVIVCLIGARVTYIHISTADLLNDDSSRGLSMDGNEPMSHNDNKFGDLNPAVLSPMTERSTTEPTELHLNSL